MKKQLRNGLAIALLATTIISCSSDDNGNGPIDPPTGVEVNPDDFRGEFTNQKIELDASKIYRLKGKVIIGKGSELIIPAGTKIIGEGGTSAYIAIAQEGKIFVNGTKEAPVVMTGVEAKRGNWGGLVICGKAPINKGTTATAEVSDLTYGGTDANDSSGSIQYLRIEYAGAAYNSEKEFNGVSFFGVGSGTKIEYVQTYEGSDDGFEWFGGTVNTKYLVSTHNDDDQFDWTEGWNGTNEFWFSKESGVANRGIEADNNSKDRSAAPIANPTIKNITLVGLGLNTPSELTETQGMKLREGTKGIIDNVVLSNWKTGFDVEHDETLANVANGSLKVTNVRFDNVETKSKGKNTAKETVDVSGVFTEKADASGAGNGAQTPEWAKGWTVGL
ncbi:hypothetical protein [Myroides guanonis]|uniref:Uncharacterized protein n=1 Tax=Myroides guanonis TaxID=1150112 RepID=A0A1I3SJ18_9FLAO|nr:hypothetical protein [Myroides guanonis]SFJ57466.1 hypothetical protein SAMN04487893_11072 [Myroides guanonis]